METKRLHTPDGTPPSHHTFQVEQHGDFMLQAINRLFKEEQLCDYTIVAEGQSFRTHRNILASVSDYFYAMLTGAMLEAKQDYVELKGVTAFALKALLKFAYTGLLNFKQCKQNYEYVS